MKKRVSAYALVRRGRDSREKDDDTAHRKSEAIHSRSTQDGVSRPGWFDGTNGSQTLRACRGGGGGRDEDGEERHQSHLVTHAHVHEKHNGTYESGGPTGLAGAT